MSFRLLFKSLLVGLFFGVLATVGAALIYTGIGGGTVPRQVVVFGVIAVIIGFAANFLMSNKSPDKTALPQTNEISTPVELEEPKLLE